MEQKNFILAIAISLAILLGWQFFITAPRQEELLRQQEAQQAAQQTAQQQQQQQQVEATTQPPQEGTRKVVARNEALALSPRVGLENSRVKGSIALKGGRLDDLILKDYRETVDPTSPNITLLSPFESKDAYYADFGWAGVNVSVPDANTEWKADSTKLTAGKKVVLTWENGQGLTFRREIALDDQFMFTVTDSVTNGGTEPVALTPYARIIRYGTPQQASQTYVLHEGAVGVLEGTLQEESYGSLKESGEEGAKPISLTSTGGWAGITDKYWLVAQIPSQQEQIVGRFFYDPKGDFYQADTAATEKEIAPGQTVSVEQHVFAGAKVVRLLDQYGDALKLPLFDRAVDFGWFYWLTRPLFLLLDWIFSVVGNFGIAILILTVIVKLAMFPLANKSYKSMSKMKLLTPQMQTLREKYGEDRQRLNQEMMELYKREKVNPASGCLPILVQIPIFYALYKVLYVTIEMRHAPFFGWIKDLSEKDPTSILNLFGLLPWDPSGLANVPGGDILLIFSIGIWPLIMGITMWIQQKLNPAPPDPVQAKIFATLPIVFTFMLGQFAAGLVIYWAWNNILSIAQQKVIMARMGVAT